MKFASVAIFGLAALVAAAPAPNAESDLAVRVVVPGVAPVHLVTRQYEDVETVSDATDVSATSDATASTDASDASDAAERVSPNSLKDPITAKYRY